MRPRYRRPYYNATPRERFMIDLKRSIRMSIPQAVEFAGNLLSAAVVVFAILFLIPIIAELFR